MWKLFQHLDILSFAIVFIEANQADPLITVDSRRHNCFSRNAIWIAAKGEALSLIRQGSEG